MMKVTPATVYINQSFCKVIVLLSLIFLSACVTIPKDRQRLEVNRWPTVRAHGANVTASGAIGTEAATISVFAWHPVAREWRFFVDIIASSTPVSSPGTELLSYNWSENILVPKWAWVHGHKGGAAKILFKNGEDTLPSRGEDGKPRLNCNNGGGSDQPCAVTLYTSNYVSPYTARGDIQCPFGARDCNVCANDVPAQFAAIGAIPTDVKGRVLPTGTAKFHSRVGKSIGGLQVPLAPFGDDAHIEGFARIPGLGDSKWFVFSRSNIEPAPGGPAGIIFAKMSDEIVSTSEALLSSDTPFFDDQKVVFMQVIEGTKHVGGIQVMGNIVAVASWCNDSSICRNAIIDFYEVEECASSFAICSRHINRFESGDNFHRAVVNSNKANFIAATRMDNGHYVLLINRTNLGHTDIFVSSKTIIDEETTWDLLETDKYKADGYDNGSDTYQNMNFVTECLTGKIFAVGLSQDGNKGRNEVDLFEADQAGRTTFDLDHVDRIILANPGRDDDMMISSSCEMKGGAGVYVSAKGKLIIYCSQKKQLDGDSQAEILFSEFSVPEQ